MPDYDISASLDLLLSKWDDVLAENPKFKQATENWARRRRPTTSRSGRPSRSLLSSHLTGYINDGKFEPRASSSRALRWTGTPAAAGASVRRRLSERGRPSAVTGGGAVGGRVTARGRSRVSGEASAGGVP